MKVAVFLPNLIGDMVMATPTLRALRKFFGPAAQLSGIARRPVPDLLAGTNWLDEIILYDAKGKSGLTSWQLIRRMRDEDFDLALLCTNSLRTGLLAWAGGARQRVGYACYGRGPLLTRRLEYPRHSQAQARVVAYPMVDYYLQLAYAVGCPQETRRLELAVTDSEQQQAHQVWQQLGLRSQVSVFNCSGGYGAAKLWPTEHFAQLARRTAQELDQDVLVLCGPSEKQTASEIVQQAAHPRVFSLAEFPLSLGLSKACIQRSQVMVTTDSGPRHMAIALGVPVVSLFGPTPAIWGENPTARETQLQLPLACSGCHRRECPLGHHRCMTDLTPDVVFQAMLARLQPQRKALAA